MKLQIIETPDYILAVSDEEIKENDYFHLDMSDNNRPDEIHQMGNNKWSKTGGINFSQSSAWTRCCKKIIAYAPKNNAPELDFPLLPEMVVEDDVEKLAEKHIENYEVFFDTKKEIDHTKIGFIAGYKAATKVYSEKDLKKVLKMLYNSFKKGYVAELDVDFQEADEIIQSLKQLTPKWFVAEMQTTKSEVFRENDNAPYAVLKTTTINGKTYLVGTYLGE